MIIKLGLGLELFVLLGAAVVAAGVGAGVLAEPVAAVGAAATGVLVSVLGGTADVTGGADVDVGLGG